MSDCQQCLRSKAGVCKKGRLYEGGADEGDEGADVEQNADGRVVPFRYSESVHTSTNLPSFTIIKLNSASHWTNSRMPAIVWHRFSNLEGRLRSVVTVSLARKDENEEIKRRINIVTSGRKAREHFMRSHAMLLSL